MKNEELFREIFTKNTIRLVSEGGFEAATTRAIAGERREVNNVRVNEAHIYRIYGKKEHLFADVFSVLDCELLAAVGSAFESIELMRGIKTVFDPKNLLNPNKIF